MRSGFVSFAMSATHSSSSGLEESGVLVIGTTRIRPGRTGATGVSLRPMDAVPAQRRTNQMAMVSLIAGIVGWVLFHPFVASLVAVYCGHKAKRELRANNFAEEGDSYATIGLVLGYVHIATTVIGCIFAVVVVQSALKFWSYAWTVLRSIPMLLFFGFITHTFLSRYWGLVESTFGETWRVAMGQM